LTESYFSSKAAEFRREEKMQKAKLWAMVLTFGLALVFPWACASSEKAPRQDKETLKSWLSDPKVAVIDVRSPGDWEKATTKIKGAVRQDPKQVKTWAETVPKDKKIVLYCA
jgi:predicted sulfurtransferase